MATVDSFIPLCNYIPCLCGQCENVIINNDSFSFGNGNENQNENNFNFDFNFDFILPSSSNPFSPFPASQALPFSENEVHSPSGNVYSLSVPSSSSSSFSSCESKNEGGVFTQSEISLFISQTSQPPSSSPQEAAVPSDNSFSIPSMEGALLDSLDKEEESVGQEFIRAVSSVVEDAPSSAEKEKERDEIKNSFNDDVPSFEERDSSSGEEEEEETQKTKKRPRPIAYAPSALAPTKKKRSREELFPAVVKQGPPITLNIAPLTLTVHPDLNKYSQEDYNQLCGLLRFPVVCNNNEVELWGDKEKPSYWVSRYDDAEHIPDTLLKAIPLYGPANLSKKESRWYNYSYRNLHPSQPDMARHIPVKGLKPMHEKEKKELREKGDDNSKEVYVPFKLKEFLWEHPGILDHFFARQVIQYVLDYKDDVKAKALEGGTQGILMIRVFAARYFPWVRGTACISIFERVLKLGLIQNYFQPSFWQ